MKKKKAKKKQASKPIKCQDCEGNGGYFITISMSHQIWEKCKKCKN